MSGIYNLTAPTLPDKARSPLQLDASGNLKTVSATTGASANQVQGNVASGVTDAGNPVKIGGVYNAGQPVLTTGQRGDLQLTTRGALQTTLMRADTGSPIAATATLAGFSNTTIALNTASATFGFNGASWDPIPGDTGGMVSQPYARTASRWQYAGVTGGITDTSDVALAAAGAAGIRNYVTSIQYHNTSAVASEIVVKDGSTVIWRGVAPATMAFPAVVPFPVPLKGTAATAMNVAMVTTATATVISAQGFTGA